MDLLERYLQAVKFWLPKEEKRDIIAEISEDLRSEIEDRENQLGRKLNQAEMEAILKERGRPVLVAGRYLPQRSLIGPALFPIYFFVLKIVALCYIVPWILVWIGFLIFAPAYRSSSHLGSAWTSLWMIVLMTFAVVTVVFAVLERAQAKSRFLEEWEPSKLPPVRNMERIPRASSLFELIAGAVFVTWLANVLRTGAAFDSYGVHITLTPGGRAICWALVCFSLAGMALSWVNLLRPYWTMLRSSVRAGMNFGGALVFLLLFKSSLLVEFAGTNLPAAKAAELTKWFNLSISWSLLAAALGCIIAGVVEIVRINRLRADRAWRAQQRTMNVQAISSSPGISQSGSRP